ncbi:hypothetical protein [Tuwongella immobilis]|uniref:Uncharacterized protein n=1 Tax=Tuwongella immobilis TaxID=692036 RepID=A0A6C2YUZ0_9BACT|nr:hypothetical protein [Tuwongella immobilis]VIP05264.1 unnamed protein product [Tuwongella immobilis]VTS07884.1 unnamed protein product [Tuwongella immobilis]
MHRIRLRAPWDRESIAAPSGGPQIRYTRRFGAPRTLEPGETVALLAAHLPGIATISLNGIAIGRLSPMPTEQRLPIAMPLAPRNTLEIIIDSDDSSPEMPGEIALVFELPTDAAQSSPNSAP